MVTMNLGETGKATSIGHGFPLGDRGLIHGEEVEFRSDHLTGSSSFISYRGLIAGTLTVVAVLVLLSTISYGFGMGTGTYGWGTGICALICSVISFFLGGAISALAGRRLAGLGVLQGLMTWALAVPLLFVLSASMFGGIHTMVTPDIVRMYPTDVGAAWGTFIALLLGVPAAIVGGIAGLLGRTYLVRWPMMAERG